MWTSGSAISSMKHSFANVFCMRPGALIQEGRNHLLLGSAIEVGCPVRILQGAQDPDVPWRHAFALAHRLPADDVVLTVIQDGDHRLSRPQDIARIIAAVAEISPSGETP